MCWQGHLVSQLWVLLRGDGMPWAVSATLFVCLNVFAYYASCQCVSIRGLLHKQACG